MSSVSWFSFILGVLYMVVGLFLLMVIDIRTGRVDQLARNNDYYIFLLVLAWPVVIPLLFLPRYDGKSRRSDL